MAKTPLIIPETSIGNMSADQFKNFVDEKITSCPDILTTNKLIEISQLLRQEKYDAIEFVVLTAVVLDFLEKDTAWISSISKYLQKQYWEWETFKDQVVKLREQLVEAKNFNFQTSMEYLEQGVKDFELIGVVPISLCNKYTRAFNQFNQEDDLG